MMDHQKVRLSPSPSELATPLKCTSGKHVVRYEWNTSNTSTSIAGSALHFASTATLLRKYSFGHTPCASSDTSYVPGRSSTRESVPYPVSVHSDCRSGGTAYFLFASGAGMAKLPIRTAAATSSSSVITDVRFSCA